MKKSKKVRIQLEAVIDGDKIVGWAWDMANGMKLTHGAASSLDAFAFAIKDQLDEKE
jgi:hypothetical protein